LPKRRVHLGLGDAQHIAQSSQGVRPPGGAKFIAYERLEEVEGASLE
jgi:hypothetical protein